MEGLVCIGLFIMGSYAFAMVLYPQYEIRIRTNQRIACKTPYVEIDDPKEPVTLIPGQTAVYQGRYVHKAKDFSKVFYFAEMITFWICLLLNTTMMVPSVSIFLLLRGLMYFVKVKAIDSDCFASWVIRIASLNISMVSIVTLWSMI